MSLPAVIERADVTGFRLLRGAARPPAVVDKVRAFSSLGEHGACWIALGAAGAAVDKDHRDQWTRGLVAVAGAYLTNVALKAIVRRKRPDVPGLEPLVSTPTQLSFPSSHATASFAAATVYSERLPARPLFAVAAAMAISRVYLGVHYPSDVAAGAALGTTIGVLCR